MKTTKEQQEFKERLDRVIDNNDYYGRSFTYGIALYNLVLSGDLSDNEDLEERLIDSISAEKNLDVASAGFSMRALVEMADISSIDEIAKELSGLSEDE